MAVVKQSNADDEENSCCDDVNDHNSWYFGRGKTGCKGVVRNAGSSDVRDAEKMVEVVKAMKVKAAVATLLTKMAKATAELKVKKVVRVKMAALAAKAVEVALISDYLLLMY